MNPARPRAESLGTRRPPFNMFMVSTFLEDSNPSSTRAEEHVDAVIRALVVDASERAYVDAG